MQTVYGIVADAFGAATKQIVVQGATRPELRRESWATPASEFRSVQGEKIPIDQNHDGIAVGEVRYLERDAAMNLWCVGEVDDSVVPAVPVRVGSELVAVGHPLFWSAATRAGDHGIGITAIALTPASARLSAHPVRFLPGSIDYPSVATDRWNLRGRELELMTRAARSVSERNRDRGPLVIEGDNQRPAALELRRAGMIEYRSVSTVDVHPDRREVDLLVAPSGVPSQIYERGRTYVEEYRHGCFASAEEEPHRVKLNRDHMVERTIGKALAFDAWSELGCVGTFRISRVADGDEALELLRDDIAACSAGFQLLPGGDRWQGNHRTILRGRLDHVAVTADPAHATRVLDVRGATIGR